MQSAARSKFRHPNVMSDAERLALPDPCRPIDEWVLPAKRWTGFFGSHSAESATMTNVPPSTLYPKEQGDIDRAIYQSPNEEGASLAEDLLACETLNVRELIQQQQWQQHAQKHRTTLTLPLALLPRLVGNSGMSLIKEIMAQNPQLLMMSETVPTTKMNDNELAIETPPPNPALLTIEQRLYLMAQLYHIMLCVFLLCQCKSRKTLNPKITLQDLTNAINRYADAHRTELNFLTQHADLSIEPKHVEFAIVALNWQRSKQADIRQRHTTISTHNPLL